MGIYAAIDIGTNSCRLLLAEREGGKIKPLRMELKTTRLGEGVSDSGYIKDQALERTVVALVKFKSYLEGYGVEKIGVVATNAAREASNSFELLKAIRDNTGFEVEIVSGEEEARLSYKGVASSMDNFAGVPVVLDIGGGSTEVIFSKNGELRDASVGVGAVRCTEDKTSPTKIMEELQSVLNEVISLGDDSELIGVGGTITTLAAIKKKLEVYDREAVHGSVLKRDEVEELFFSLFDMTLEERKGVPGLQPERADIITAGALILWLVLTYLEKDEIIVSETDILHGILLDL